MVDEKTEVIKVESKEASRKNVVRIIAVAILVIFLIVIITIKINNPEVIKTKTIFIIGGAILVFSTVMFYSFELYSKLQKLQNEVKEKDNLPKPATEEELYNRIDNYITNDKINGYQNHIKSYHAKEYNINKNKIYIFGINLLYEDDVLGNSAYIIINAHFVNDIPTVLPGKTSEAVLFKHVNLLSTAPRDDPETEETRVFNPMTGTESVYKKVRPVGRPPKEKTEEKDIE